MCVGLALALAGCQGAHGGPPGMGRGQGGEQQPPEERPSPVLITTVERGTIQGRIRAASTIEAELQVTVHAESTGRITSLDLEEGDEIKEGAVLARIKRDAQSLGFERAETNLADVEREFARVEQLYKQGIASQTEYDQAKTKVDAARLDIKDRRRDLSNTVVKAPFAGVVTRRFVDPGGFVSNGAQMFEITDFDTLVARVYVPEKELDRVAVGQSAEIVGKAAKNRQGTGEVKRIAPVVDATTGTVKVTIGLPEALAGGANGFLPGMYAEVTLTTEVHADVPIVPKPALVHEDEQTFVFVAEGDRAKKQLIEVGLADDDFVEIVAGLEVGARIIVAGQAGLKDGGLITEVDAKGRPVGEAASESAAETDAAADSKAVAKAG
ncbi:MAG TPA: efflux RND transporter periplasmic adaptor subunit [Enhygromyxa sp.]|nr:efflux RND transporter periplasmic adaptor subunit [Enhygromyxa sp.]